MAKKRVMVEMVAGLAPQLGDVLTWGGEAWEPRAPGPRAHRLTHVHTDRLPTVMMGDQESPNFEDGVDGWRMRASGDVQFNNIVARGTIYADEGDIGGWDIEETWLSSGSIKFDSDTPAILLGDATDYMTGIGVWMGNDGGTYKMHIGDPGARHARWDGEAMFVSGLYSLEGPLLVCRYDGPYPFETDFSGNPNGHFGQIATKSGGVIFRPGVFGKGVQVAEATTNLPTNPSFETGTTGWATYGANTIEQSAEQAFCGSYSMRCTYQDNLTLTYTNITLTAAAHTYSVWMWIPSDYDGQQVRINFANFTGVSGTTYASADMTKRDQWQRVVCANVTPDAGDLGGNLAVYESGTLPTAGRFIYIDAVQCEAKAYVTPYCDGSLGDGHAWGDGAHASTSSRTAASLTYDGYVDELIGSQGTVCGWWVVGTVPSSKSGGYSRFFDARGADNNNRILIGPLHASDMFYLYVNGNYQVYNLGSGSLSHGDVIFCCATWDFDNDEYTLDVWENDGTHYSGSGSASLSMPTLTDLAIGLDCGGALHQINGVIDDVAIFNRALTADEIDAIYHSGGPLQARTSNWEWRLKTGDVWGDEEGLWVRDADENAAFGVCAVDGKSWGGFTLNKADVCVGRNTSGSSAMLWDISEGKFGFYGDGDGTPQVEVDTDGTLTAGAGAKVFNTEGSETYSSGDADIYDKWYNEDITSYADHFGFVNLQKTDPNANLYGIFNFGLRHDSNNQSGISAWLNEVDVVIQKGGTWRYIVEANYDYVRVNSVPFRVATGASDPTVGVEDGVLFYRTDTDKLRLRANGAWVSLN